MFSPINLRQPDATAEPDRQRIEDRNHIIHILIVGAILPLTLIGPNQMSALKRLIEAGGPPKRALSRQGATKGSRSGEGPLLGTVACTPERPK
jgi:hypothetical protein